MQPLWLYRAPYRYSVSAVDLLVRDRYLEGCIRRCVSHYHLDFFRSFHQVCFLWYPWIDRRKVCMARWRYCLFCRVVVHLYPFVWHRYYIIVLGTSYHEDMWVGVVIDDLEWPESSWNECVSRLYFSKFRVCTVLVDTHWEPVKYRRRVV